jgi:hypothetical protein
MLSSHNFTSRSPLAPDELVTDQMLHALVSPEPSWQSGEISAERQGQLVMYLQDLGGELMAYRKAARIAPKHPFPDQRNHAEEIANARAAVDRDAIERIESLLQHMCHETATANATLATLLARQ